MEHGSAFRFAADLDSFRKVNLDLVSRSRCTFSEESRSAANMSADPCSILSQIGCLGAIPDVDLFANQSKSE